MIDDENEINTSSKNKTKEEIKWKDEDDENLEINLNSRNKLKKLKKDKTESIIKGNEYQERIREQYNLMHNEKEKNLFKWAEGIEDDNSNSNNINGELDLILKTNKSIMNDSKILSSSNILKINQLPQITKLPNYKHNSIITSLNFHPYKNNIIVSTGLDKTMKIFQIEKENDNKSTLLKTINTIDMPIFSSNFITNDELIITGRRKHYFIYNIQLNKLNRFEGHFATSSNEISSLEKCFVGFNSKTYAFGDSKGNAFIYDINTKRFKYDLKINSSINAICFDEINIYLVGDQSEIFIFDIRKYRNCVNKINDNGNIFTNCMDISFDYNFLATGSKNGYVNIYKVDDLKNSSSDEVEPIKVIDNLTTSCDYVKFNKSSNILGMSSKWKKNAIRLFNLDTMKMYSNFPSFKERIKYPFCIDFNSDNSYFAIGNDEGKLLLYQTEY
jgi:U3 small nucleolar RNA-associated protein 18